MPQSTLIITSISVDYIGINVPAGMPNPISSSTVQLQRSHNGEPYNTITAVIQNGSTKTDAVIDLTGIADRDITDKYLIQLIDGGINTDRVAVIIASTFGADHTTTCAYILPSDAGNYSFSTTQVNGEPFIVTSSSTLVVGNMPDTAYSKISIDKDSFVKFAGRSYNVTMLLSNAANDTADGNYEIAFQTDKL